MSLVIEDPEVEALIERLSAATGETATEAVRRAVGDQLAKLPTPSVVEKRREGFRRFHEAMDKLPILDTRSADEIIGYNEQGMFD